LEKENWRTDFTWTKAHVGHSGDELGEKLAKEAIKNSEVCITNFRKAKQRDKKQKIL